MNFPLRSFVSLALMGTVVFTTGQAKAVTFVPTDLDSFNLGPLVVGPVGPQVETTFVNISGEGVGDLISSVACPFGFALCDPSANPVGTIYTYLYEVTPGVDFPNDPPFPSPSTILPLENVTDFGLGFGAEGFNNVIGFSFSQAAAANPGANITIEQRADNSLVWNLSANAGWSTGETITFFWQTTQPPSGPGGTYGIANAAQAGFANGPLPTTAPNATVPEPSFSPLFGLAGLVFLVKACRRFAR